MADQVVSVVFRMRDQISATLESVEQSVKGIEGAFKKMTDSGERQAQKLSRTFSRVKQLAIGIGAALGFAGATATATKAVAAFANYERGLIGIEKTTNISGQALAQLGQNIQGLSRDIRVNVDDLLAIGQAAGQLGVTGAANIQKFVETVGQVGLASNLAGEEAATTFARILNVAGEPIETVDKLASAIVGLGNTFAANEKQIARQTQELVRSTAAFGVTSAEAAGLGAALASFGVRPELGASAIGRTFRTINEAVVKGGDALERVAIIAGTTGEAFRRSFEAKPFEGFLQFIEGLGPAGSEASLVMAEVGLLGDELAKVLPVLGKEFDTVTRAIKESTEAYADGNRHIIEAAKAGETLIAKWTEVQNSAKELGVVVTEVFEDQIRGSIDTTIGFIDKIKDAAEALATLRTASAQPGELPRFRPSGGEVITGLKNLIVKPLQAIKGFVAGIGEALGSTDKSLRERLEIPLDRVSEAVLGLARSFDDAGIQTDIVTQKMGGVPQAIKEVADAVEVEGDRIRTGFAALFGSEGGGDVLGRLQRRTQFAAFMKEEIKAVESDRRAEELRTKLEGIRGEKDFLKEIGKALAERRKLTQDTLDRIGELEDQRLSETIAGMEKLARREVEIHRERLAAGLITTAEFVRVQGLILDSVGKDIDQKIGGTFGEFGLAIGNALGLGEDAALSLGDTIESISNSIASSGSAAFQNWISGAQSAKASIRSWAQDVIRTINDVIVRLLVLKAIEASLGFLTGLFTGGGSGIAATTGSGGGVGFTDIPSAPLPALLHGGIVKSPTIGLLGEGGVPEAVIPLGSARGSRELQKAGITSEREVGMPGSESFTVNLNIFAADPKSGMKFVLQNKEAIGKAVIDQIARDTGFRQRIRDA